MRTHENTAIVYDSTADLPAGPRTHPNWAMVPLTLQFGTESFRDYVDLDIEEFYRRLAAAPLPPTTSQPTPAAFADCYRDLLDRYEHVVSIHLSGKLSGTVESARLAASETPGRVTVIDSRGVSVLLAMAVLGVEDLLERGTTIEAIEAFCERHATEARCFFSVDTLEYLQRGGRIGKAAAFVGQLLSVRPILTIADGELQPLTRVRGSAKVVGALLEQLDRALDGAASGRVAIAHAAAPAAAERLAAAVRAARPDVEIDGILTLGAVVGTHSGPGALGLAVTARHV
jgi:DegV family protein with EDD domain